jgi:hypothetical protein
LDAVTKTAGTWDRSQWPTYFVAASWSTLEVAQECHPYLLVAVNELHDKGAQGVKQWAQAGKSVLVDSGVYWLSTQHAKAHDLTMDQALGLAPAKVDGFEELFTRYVSLVTELGDLCWGYIEIDQGGRENKIKTRAKLEDMGLRPIPVYHPINDGWDYFDYLAQRYDRICFGNVVNADQQTRKRLVATAWERRRKYPHLWIHLLGLTPSDLTTAFPSNSCDSSTWISGVRWGVHSTSIAHERMQLADGFTYRHGDDSESERGHAKAWRLCGYDAFMTMQTMRTIKRNQEDELGADVGLFADHYN